MSLYVIGGQKGGTGKSTLATNLAVAFTRSGRHVLLVDTDRQLTASHWSDARERDPTLPPITTVQKTGTLYRVLVDTTELYDEVIVDAGGFDSVELRTALAAADHLYSPVKASQSDLWTLEAMSELVLQARDLNPSLGAHLVLSLAPTNPSVSSARDARRLLEQYPAFGICEAVIHNRKAFEDATAGGRGVLEGPDVKAQNEILAFSREVMSHGISASLSQAS